MTLDINVLLVAIFLLISFAVGIAAGKGVNTFEKFSVGDKNFKTSTLVATLVATGFGGGFIFYGLQNTYTSGWYYILAVLGRGSSCFIAAYLMVPRMGEFIKHFSVAESMGSIFGRPVRIATAISGVLRTGGSMAIQFQVISKVIKLSLDVETNISICVAAVMVLLYSLIGGVKAVTFTDVIQFLAFSTLLPVMIHAVGKDMGPNKSIMDLLTTHENFDLRQVVGWDPPFRQTLLLMLLFLIPDLHPAWIQRFYMSKNVWQAQRVFSYTGGFALLIKLLVVTLGTMLFTSNDQLNPSELVSHIIKVCAFDGSSGLICMGLLALAMSTADSNLNAAAVLFTNDIFPSEKLDDEDKLTLSRIFSFIIGGIGLFFALQESNLWALVILTISLYAPIVLPPFIMAICGFRPAARSVLFGMGVGAISILVLSKFGLAKDLGISNTTIPATSMGMNLLFLMGSHYLFPKVANTGWVGIKDKTPLIQKAQEKKRKQLAWEESKKNFHLYTYLKNLLPKQQGIFPLVGGYVVVMRFVQLFTADVTIHHYLNMVIIVLGTCSIVYPTFTYRHPKVIRLFPYIWLLLIFVFFFVVSGYHLHTNSYQGFSAFVFGCNILVALILFPKRVVVPMVLSVCMVLYWAAPQGTSSLVLLYQSLGGKVANFLAAWGVLISTITGVLLSKKFYYQSLEKIQYLQSEQEKEKIAQIRTSYYIEHLDRLTRDKLDNDEILPDIAKSLMQIVDNPTMVHKEVAGLIKHNISRLSGYANFIEERMYYQHTYLPIQVTKADIQEIITTTIYEFDKENITFTPIVHCNTENTLLECDPAQLVRLIITSMHCIKEDNIPKGEHIVNIYVDDATIRYDLTTNREAFKKQSALALIITRHWEAPEIEKDYEEVLDAIVTSVKRNVRDLYISKMDQIVDAHYGCFYVHTRDNHTSVTSILPRHLHDIRNKVMDSVPKDFEFKVATTSSSEAQEKSLEKLLLSKTTLKQDFIQATIQFIKKCHGDQTRESGSPYYTHPMSVAEILLMETRDEDAIIAALLHDVLEDTKVPRSYIKARFGPNVAHIVNKVTNMSNSFRKKKLTKEEAEALLVSCEKEDIRVAQVKLADRLHNVRTLKYRPKRKQVQVAQQTLSIYIPLAVSLGIDSLAKELKQRCEEIVEENA